MASPQSDEIRSEIILLTSYLAHQSSSEAQPKSRDRSQKLLGDMQSLAAVLTTGSVESVTAASVVAVFGVESEPGVYTRVISTENTTPLRGSQLGNNRRQVNLDTLPTNPNSGRDQLRYPMSDNG